MKFIFAIIISTQFLHAKEYAHYTCAVDKEIKVELYLLDKNNPSVSLVNKNSKFGLCFYQVKPSQLNSNRAVNLETVWNLELQKCDYYSEKLKTKLALSPLATFKQSPGKSPGYFQLLKDQQPLFCTPTL